MMINFNTHLTSNLFKYALIVCVLIAPVASWAINNAGVEKIKAVSVADGTPLTASTPPKHKRKKQGKLDKKPMNNPLVSVPIGIWGTHGVIVNVEEKIVSIQYDCADGKIEQTLKMDPKGNFAANGFHTARSPGPVLKDAQPERNGARYEGKISGDTMTLKVTLIKTKKVIGNFKLKRGEIPEMTQCY